MSKIFLGMVAIFLATSMQAAQIQWNSGALYTPNSTTGAYTTLTGEVSTGYIATITFYTRTGTGTPGDEYVYTLVTGVTGTVSEGTNKSSIITGATSDSFAANTYYYASIYITDPSGKWYLAQDYKEVYIPSSGPGSAPFSFGTSGSWSLVPEPATMALLGIGVVAVGLRRRRK